MSSCCCFDSHCCSYQSLYTCLHLVLLQKWKRCYRPLRWDVWQHCQLFHCCNWKLILHVMTSVLLQHDLAVSQEMKRGHCSSHHWLWKEAQSMGNLKVIIKHSSILRTVNIILSIFCAFKPQCWLAEWITSFHWQEDSQIDTFNQIEVFELSTQADTLCMSHRILVCVADHESTALSHCRTLINRPTCRAQRLKVMNELQTDKGHWRRLWQIDKAVA